MRSYKLTANELMGVIIDAKSVLATLNRALDETRREDRRGFSLSDREGALFKINPTFDVNGTRTIIKQLRTDIEGLERQLFAYNATTNIGIPGATVASGLKEARLLGQKVSEASHSFTGAVSGMLVEGDDTVEEDMYELYEEFLNSLTTKRQYKQRVADANGGIIEVTFESDVIARLIEKGVLPIN